MYVSKSLSKLKKYNKKPLLFLGLLFYFTSAMAMPCRRPASSSVETSQIGMTSWAGLQKGGLLEIRISFWELWRAAGSRWFFERTQIAGAFLCRVIPVLAQGAPTSPSSAGFRVVRVCDTVTAIMGLSSASSNTEDLQFCVFDLKRGQHEGQELDKILFFYPADLPFPSQLSVIGLSEGLITFTR